jgi:hypothetical protein
MARKGKAKKPSSKKLKGGVGSEAAPSTGILGEVGRYELAKTSMLDRTRKAMQVKDEERRAQVAGSLLSAARQHAITPDEGSRLYGRAFAGLTNSEQDVLLSALSPEEASIVRTSFSLENVVEAEPAPARTRPSENTPDTPEERARAQARRALDAIYGNLESIPVVDLNKRVPSAPSSAKKLPVGKGDTVETVDSPSPDWTKAQIQRGYRKILYAPDKQGRAPRTVVEVLADRQAEFFTGDEPKNKRKENPNYGKTRQFVREKPPAPEPQSRSLGSVRFIALSDDAQKAAVEGGNIMQVLRDIDDALDAAEGTADYDSMLLAVEQFEASDRYKRLQSRLSQLARDYPESVDFMDNPGLESRSMPTDVAPEASGRDVLPASMTLGYRVKDREAKPGWETRGDRRTRDGIPADAPNRQMWMDVNEIEAAGATARLPYPDEISGSRRPKDVDSKNVAMLPRQPFLGEGAALLETPEQTAKRVAREAELDAEYQAEAARLQAAGQGDSGPAQTAWVSEEFDSPEEPQYGSFYLDRGTATGSPGRVKADRDFALREGRSFQEKMAEKLWRAANEMEGQPDDGPSTKGSPGYTRPEKKPLNLDGLVPAWRALMYFQEGDKVVIRRPNAYEVAGFLIDRASIPDQSLALKLEPYVRRSMDALEGEQPKSQRATELAGRILEPSDRAMKDMTEGAMSLRMPGDTRPVLAQEAQALLDANPTGMMTPVQMTGTGDDLAALRQMADESDAAQADTGAPLPVDDNAVNAFNNFINASKGGKGTNTIMGLMALLGGTGAASQAQSAPPREVEYLAMGNRGRPKRTVATTVNPQPLPPRGGASTQGTAPQGAATQAPAAQAAPAPTPAPAPAPAAPPPPGGPPGGPPKTRTWDEYFQYDPIYKGGKAVGSLLSLAGRIAPSVGTAAAGAAALPYVATPVIKKYQEMSDAWNRVPEPQPPSPTDLEAELDALDRELEGLSPAAPQPQPQQEPFRSTSRITALRNLLNS